MHRLNGIEGLGSRRRRSRWRRRVWQWDMRRRRLVNSKAPEWSLTDTQCGSKRRKLRWRRGLGYIGQRRGRGPTRSGKARGRSPLRSCNKNMSDNSNNVLLGTRDISSNIERGLLGSYVLKAHSHLQSNTGIPITGHSGAVRTYRLVSQD